MNQRILDRPFGLLRDHTTATRQRETVDTRQFWLLVKTNQTTAARQLESADIIQACLMKNGITLLLYDSFKLWILNRTIVLLTVSHYYCTP